MPEEKLRPSFMREETVEYEYPDLANTLEKGGEEIEELARQESNNMYTDGKSFDYRTCFLSGESLLN